MASRSRHNHQARDFSKEDKGENKVCKEKYDMRMMPTPMPDGWGSPRYFFWVPSWGKYYCRLCWKYCDDKHAESRMHRTRLRWPDQYLKYKSPVEHPRELMLCPIYEFSSVVNPVKPLKTSDTKDDVERKE